MPPSPTSRRRSKLRSRRARRVVARRFDVRALDLPGIGGALLRTELRVLDARQVRIPIPDDAHEPDTAATLPQRTSERLSRGRTAARPAACEPVSQAMATLPQQ
jgi:hypothetical protein